jgi:hypothetical protein
MDLDGVTAARKDAEIQRAIAGSIDCPYGFL